MTLLLYNIDNPQRERPSYNLLSERHKPDSKSLGSIERFPYSSLAHV